MRYDTGMTAMYGHVNSKCFHFMYISFKFMPKMPAIMGPAIPAAKLAIDKDNLSCPPAPNHMLVHAMGSAPTNNATVLLLTLHAVICNCICSPVAACDNLLLV